MPFSRLTFSALAEVLSTRGHPTLLAFFYRYGLESSDRGGNQIERALALVRAIEHDDATFGSVEKTTVDLLEEIEPKLDSDPAGAKLIGALAVDGYAFVGGRVALLVAPEIEEVAPVSKLEATLHTKGFDVAAAHYKQAVAGLVDGQYEAANGQVRSAMEAFFQNAPTRVGKPAATNAAAGIQTLHNAGVLDKGEESFVKSFWNLIQDEGPHAGLTSPDEAGFRARMASVVLSYVLAKLPPS